MTDRLRVGSIGAHPSPFGIRGFAVESGAKMQPLEGVELTAVSEINEAAAQQAQQFFGFKERYVDYREMLQQADLDAVVIALPTNLHKQATIDALEAGCHVLCEKPPTNTVEEMQEVAEAVQKNNRRYMFVRQSRFLPNVQLARKMVLAGELGEVYAAETSWVRSRGTQIKGTAWRSRRDEGGGVLLDLGIHGIDQAWFCMGNPKPVEVMAMTHAAFRHFSVRPDDYTADDTCICMIRFDTGAVLQGLFAFGMNAIGPPDEKDKALPYSKEWQTSKLFGTAAGLDIDLKLIMRGPVDDVKVASMNVPEAHEHPMVNQAREFVAAIQEGREPLNNVEDALTLMKMLTALKKSGDNRQSVSIQ